MDCINAYLNALSTLLSDQDGTPVFDSLSKGDKEMCRITRTGLSKWMDELLLKAGITKKQLTRSANVFLYMQHTTLQFKRHQITHLRECVAIHTTVIQADMRSV